MEKAVTKAGQESGAALALAPAEFELVGIEKGVKEVYVPLLSRTYTIDELKRPDIGQALLTLGWPHIKKA